MGMRGKILDWDIQALIDGALSVEEESVVLEALDSDPELQRRYNELVHQKNLIKSWWKDH